MPPVPGGPLPWVALGIVVQAAIVLLPTFFVGGVVVALRNPVVATFLTFSAAFCVPDLLRGLAGHVPRPAVANAGAAESHASLQSLLLLLVFWSALCEHLQAPAADRTGAIGQGLGLLLLGGGLACRATAIRTLGRHFVTALRVDQDQPLVTHGPYRWVRHPSELGLLAFALGAALWFGAIFTLALWAFALVPASVVRIQRENQVLSQAFGSAWTDYAARTRNLLPWIW